MENCCSQYFIFCLYMLPYPEHGFDYAGGVIDKVLVKLGLKEYQASINWILESWKSSLDAMDYDADIVFFGDSITRGGQWTDAFPEENIVNLGISGDSIRGMTNRVDMVASVTPEKVFLLGGINSLTDRNCGDIIEQYRALLENFKAAIPDADLFVQSVLPISMEKEKDCADNDVIAAFNEELEKLASEYGATYIDIHGLYTLNGSMNPELTKDGIHLKPEAYNLWYETISAYVKQ